jgi:hypothetical protein
VRVDLGGELTVASNAAAEHAEEAREQNPQASHD